MNGRSESPSPNALLAALDWLVGALLGPAATAVAVIAVVTIGLLMLRGRVSVRDAGQVLLGCFILFGAGTIAVGLCEVAEKAGGGGYVEPELVATAVPDTQPARSAPYDPYAGAAVRYEEPLTEK